MPDLDVVFHERTLGLRLEWEAPNLTFDTVRCIVVSDNQGRIPAGSVLLRVNGIEPQVRPRNVTVSYATFLDSLRDMPRPLTVTFRVQDDWKTLANATAARQTARADAPHRKRILEETKSERAEANAARLGSNAYHASIFAAAAPARPAHPAAAAAPARPAHPVALAAGAAARPAQPAPSAVADPVRPAHPAAPAAAPPARPTHPAGSAPPAWPAHPVAPAAAPPARPVHPAASAPPARPAHPAAPTAAPTAAPPARPAHPAAPAAAAPARSTHPAAHAAAATARPVQPAAFAPPTRSAHPAPSAAGVAARPGSAPPVGDGWLEPRFGPTGKVSSPAEAYTARPANATRLAPGAALAKSRIPRGTRYESAPPPPVLRGFATASLPASPGSTSALKVPLRLAVGQAPPRPAVRPTNFDRPALLTKDAREDSGSRVGAAPQSLQTFFVEPVNVLVEPANVRPPPPQPAPRAQPQPQQRPQAQEPQEPQSQPAQPQSRPAQQPAQPQARQTQPQSLPAQSQSRPAQSQPAPRPAQPQAQPAQPQSMPAQPPARPQSQPAAQPQRPQPAAQTSRPAAQAQSSPAAQMQRPQASQPARCRPLPQRKKVSMLSHPAPPRLAAGATSPTSPTPTSDSEKGFLAVSSNESLSRPPRNRDDESMGESSSDDDGAAVHLKRVQERFSHVAERMDRSFSAFALLSDLQKTAWNELWPHLRTLGWKQKACGGLNAFAWHDAQNERYNTLRGVMEAAIAKNQLPVPPRPIKPKPAGAAVGKAPVQWDFDVVWGMMRSSRKRGYADSSHEAMRSTFVTEDRRITGATRVTNAGVAHGWGTVATRVIRSGETFVDVRAVYSPRISPELMAKKSDSYIKYQDGLFKVNNFGDEADLAQRAGSSPSWEAASESGGKYWMNEAREAQVAQVRWGVARRDPMMLMWTVERQVEKGEEVFTTYGARGTRDFVYYRDADAPAPAPWPSAAPAAAHRSSPAYYVDAKIPDVKKTNKRQLDDNSGDEDESDDE